MHSFVSVINTDQFEEAAFFQLIKYSIIRISIIIQPVVTVNRAVAASGSPNTNICTQIKHLHIWGLKVIRFIKDLNTLRGVRLWSLRSNCKTFHLVGADDLKALLPKSVFNLRKSKIGVNASRWETVGPIFQD